MLNDNHTNANDWARQTVNTLSDTLAQNRTQDSVQTFNQAPQAPYISAEQQLNAGLFSQSAMQNNSAPATTSSQSGIGGGFGHNAFASSSQVNAFTGEPLQSNTMAGDISTLSLDNGDGGGNSFGQSSVGAFNQAPSTFNVSAQAISANPTGINMTPTQWGVVNNPAVRNPIRDILKKMGRWPTIEANVETWQNNTRQNPSYAGSWAISKAPQNEQLIFNHQSGKPYRSNMDGVITSGISGFAESMADMTETASVGYATGASLGNFDEAMGAATAAVTGNSDNYIMGRDATRKLQNELQQRHPYIYGASEFVGAMTTPMHLVKDTTFANKAFNAFTDTLNASAGYANNWNDFATNLAVNGFANAAGLPIDAIPFTRAVGRPLVKFGKKFIKQGINSSADKMKNMYYDEYEDEEKYHY